MANLVECSEATTPEEYRTCYCYDGLFKLSSADNMRRPKCLCDKNDPTEERTKLVNGDECVVQGGVRYYDDYSSPAFVGVMTGTGMAFAIILGMGYYYWRTRERVAPLDAPIAALPVTQPPALRLRNPSNNLNSLTSRLYATTNAATYL